MVAGQGSGPRRQPEARQQPTSLEGKAAMANVSLWQARSEYLEYLRAQGMAAKTVHSHGIGHDGALRRVSSMLGHSSTSITEHYLGVDAERRQRNSLLAGKPVFGAA